MHNRRIRVRNLILIMVGLIVAVPFGSVESRGNGCKIKGASSC